MKLRKSKKGFTIVELVIVIAVIGVLAAILIPTFISLSDKARKANDDSLVANLNKCLIAQEQEPTDTKNETMHDAVKDLKLWGYSVPELVARSDKDLLWNSKTNRFVLSDDEEVAAGKAVDFWKVSNTLPAPASQSYSVYAGADWVHEGAVNVKVGFDAGYNEDIETINYENTVLQHVTIRTNGGALNITAPNDTVKHYGYADSLNIVSVAPTSYHEHGEVGYAKIANGRLVVEESAKIDGVYLVANNSGEFDGIKLAVVGQAKLPELARADVSLSDGQSKLVVEVQTLTTSDGVDANPEYVWISKSGTTVSATVSSSDDVADYAEHVVENPTPAAAATKEEAKEAAAPITDNSEARINAVGYATLKDAFTAAKDGDTVALLKDITVDVSNSADFGLYQAGTKYYGIFYYLEKACNIDGRNHTITTANATKLPDGKINTGFIYYDYRAQSVSVRNLNIVSQGFCYAVTYGGINTGLMENCKITADNCCATISVFSASDPRGGVLTINDCEFSFIKGDLTRSDYAPYAAPVASQYGSDVIINNSRISATDGGALCVWPSGGSVTANNCNIICSENVAYSWIGNGPATTKTDSVININNSTITGSSTYNVNASTGSSNSGQHHTASIYVDGVLIDSVTEA